MSLGSAAPPSVYALDSDDDYDNVKNRSISELISTLRTACRTSDFDRVEEILVAKEAKLKKEMEKIKTKNALLYSQCEVEKLDKITLEDELGRHKRENEELKKLLYLVDEDRKAKQEREKKAGERYEKLLEKVKKGGQEDEMVIFELRSKNSELESAKLRVERELEVWRERFGELDIGALQLEEDTAILRNARLRVSKNNEKVGLSGNGGVENENNVGNCSVAVKIEDNVFDCDRNTHVAVGAGRSFCSPVEGDGDLQNAGLQMFEQQRENLCSDSSSCKRTQIEAGLSPFLMGKVRKKVSEVWLYFEQQTIDGIDFGFCNHCGAKYKVGRNYGTKNLHVHLQKCLKNQGLKQSVMARTNLQPQPAAPGPAHASGSSSSSLGLVFPLCQQVTFSRDLEVIVEAPDDAPANKIEKTIEEVLADKSSSKSESTASLSSIDGTTQKAFDNAVSHPPSEEEKGEKEVAKDGQSEKIPNTLSTSSAMSSQTKTVSGAISRLEALMEMLIGSTSPRVLSPKTELEKASKLLSSLHVIGMDAAMEPEMNDKIFKAIATIEADPNLQVGTVANLKKIKKNLEKINSWVGFVNDIETKITKDASQKEKLQTDIKVFSSEVTSLKKEKKSMEKKFKTQLDLIDKKHMERLNLLERAKSELSAIEEKSKDFLENLEAIYQNPEKPADLFNSLSFP